MTKSVKSFLKPGKKISQYLPYFISSLLGMVIGGLLVFYLTSNVSVIEKKLETTELNVEENSAVIEAVQKASPAVVSITAEQATLDFFGRIRESKASGTGFFVSEDGLIVTNKHVVESDRADYSVFTSDGKEYDAKVLARDPFFDVAFLKISGSNFPTVEMGNSDSLVVGQRVVAIGNALGQFQNTVTTGVISAIGRAIEAGDSLLGESVTLENMIQTDAAINPGNSGGPLINLSGQVVGINTAVAGEAEGIGFATPINVVKTVLDSVKKDGKIVRPMIGIRYININKEFATRNNLKVNYGALIYASGNDLAVIPGTPAFKAGLKEGDIITKINDYEIKEGQSLITILANFKPGDRVTITYIRDNHEQKTELTLAKNSYKE